MTKDYSITMQDSTGRIVTLCINGATIDEVEGYANAKEEVEGNAFQNAIDEGLIGSDAWQVS